MTHRSTRLLILVSLLAAPMAHAELSTIAWDATERFEHSASVPTGKFLEVCGRLSKGQTVSWSFKSDQAMNFNIHYHADDKKVVFPAKRDGVANLEDRLIVPVDQDYCWMWSNKSAVQAKIALQLQR